MTKLTINKAPGASADSPSAQVAAKAAAAITVHDTRGRAITLRNPGVLAQYRLIEALGATAANETYMRMVMPLLYVGEIDGDSAIYMSKKSEVEALIQRLDEDGVAAVMAGVAEHYGQQDPEAEKATLKN